ncbi:MAG: aminotransferase class V-fold PLP-dependent enzyme [Thiogranum sp.]|jgi:tyrosine decarboxylase / aspartate 1-decarboxylase|nr:aminotransferase class V-fold PLP-dependent enzyme [Thiogranum sp.]
MNTDNQEIARLEEALDTLTGLPSCLADPSEEGLHEVLEEVSRRLQDNLPYPHPLYAGQMMKAPHRIARLAYMLALWTNPNNHSHEGGRASTAMEKEAVAALAAMFNWQTHIGHLCSGGTIANLEALWIAAKLRPGTGVLASAAAHYSHRRACELLQLDFHAVATDARGTMDLVNLERHLADGRTGTVVVTLGTTALGALDPLPAILALREQYDFRVHVDAAYGGYFTLVGELPVEARACFDALAQVDSITIDPHKHGLQPYGCGCVLFRDPALAPLYHHQAPYAYFTTDALHLGEISLECSRPGATAVALWATQRLLPLVRGGRFSRDLARSLQAAAALYAHLDTDPRFLTLTQPQLDIVVWAPRGVCASSISARSHALFEATAAAGLHLALVSLPAGLLQEYWREVEFDTPTVTCLRSCLMKPEHADWLERICCILDSVADAATV